jgi:hypothetical protein
MILAGVGTAAYLAPAFETRDPVAEQRVSDVVAITTMGKAPAVSTAVAAPPPLPAPAVLPAYGSVPPAAAVKPAPVALAPPPAVAQRPLAVEPLPVRRDTAALPAREGSRVALTRDIQRELRRVGCYAGDADGEWTPATRAAMKTFIDRVNATLPIDEPDHILKTLVQGHPGDACGKSCPAGQSMTGDGRCLPSAVLTKISPKRPINGRETAAVQRKEAPAAASSWAPTVAAAPIAPPTAALAAPSGAAATAAAALPGRMTVGAPIATEPAAVGPAGSRVVIKPKGDASEPGAPPQTAALDPALDPTSRTDPRYEQRPERADRRVPPPGVILYRPPPPRYVYAPPVYRERSSFGPSIFRRLDNNGR